MCIFVYNERHFCCSRGFWLVVDALNLIGWTVIVNLSMVSWLCVNFEYFKWFVAVVGFFRFDCCFVGFSPYWSISLACFLHMSGFVGFSPSRTRCIPSAAICGMLNASCISRDLSPYPILHPFDGDREKTQTNSAKKATSYSTRSARAARYQLYVPVTTKQCFLFFSFSLCSFLRFSLLFAQHTLLIRPVYHCDVEKMHWQRNRKQKIKWKKLKTKTETSKR